MKPPPQPRVVVASPAPQGGGGGGEAGGAGPRALLFVDGIDGSGKSVLAARMAACAQQAGIGAVILPIDDFRRPVDWKGDGRRPEADVYYDDYYDLPLLDRCLAAFARGASAVEIPIFDAAAHRLNGRRQLSFTGATLAIVEGVFTMRLSVMTSSTPLIFLRASLAMARSRIVARDTARGRAPGEVEHRIAARYFPAYQRYLRDFDPAQRADVVFDNEDLEAPRLVRFRAGRFAGATPVLLQPPLAVDEDTDSDTGVDADTDAILSSVIKATALGRLAPRPAIPRRVADQP